MSSCKPPEGAFTPFLLLSYNATAILFYIQVSGEWPKADWRVAGVIKKQKKFKAEGSTSSIWENFNFLFQTSEIAAISSLSNVRIRRFCLSVYNYIENVGFWTIACLFKVYQY